MLFTLEAVFAKYGDALILHYGTVDDRRWLLIDGGPPGVYGRFLRPRLEQLRSLGGLGEEQSLPLELVMVSHIDEDHISGILDLYDEELSADEMRRALPFKIKRLWHNSFDDLIGGADEFTAALTAALPDPADVAVVASVGQGRNLRRASEKLATGGFNTHFDDLVVAGGGAASLVDLGQGLSLRVICPSQQRVDAFREVWRRELVAIRNRQRTAAEVATIRDVSPTNLASIVVLAEMSGRTMLLTGDARGDDIVVGLEGSGCLSPDGGPFHTDLLKMPHHGSSRNVDEDFFRRVVADHYVFSADGRDGNPDPETLAMLAAARGGDEYTLHFTIPSDGAEKETNAERQACLSKVMEWLSDERPPNCRVVFRNPEGAAQSVVIELGNDAI